MDFTPGQHRLLVYWGEIQSAVSQRASTAELWAAVRAAAEAEGVSLKGASAIDLGALRSIAASQRNAMDNLTRSRVDTAITADMIARDLSSRSQQDQNLAPRFLVRFQHDVAVEGELQTLWRTSFIDGVLPSTKNDLLGTITQDALALADDYGVTHIGVGLMQIFAV